MYTLRHGEHGETSMCSHAARSLNDNNNNNNNNNSNSNSNSSSSSSLLMMMNGMCSSTIGKNSYQEQLQHMNMSAPRIALPCCCSSSSISVGDIGLALLVC